LDRASRSEEVVKHDITGLQDELDNLEIERATSFDELDELERGGLHSQPHMTSTLAVAPRRAARETAARRLICNRRFHHGHA
jgi:hypothetical protein